MFNTLRNKIRGLISAVQAGRIVGRCKTGCRLDDETESVIPCFIHALRIAELAAVNASCYDDVREGDPGTITHMEAVADRYFAELLPLEDDIMEHSVFDDELDAEEAEEARRDKELDAYEALANALDNFGRHQR